MAPSCKRFRRNLKILDQAVAAGRPRSPCIMRGCLSFIRKSQLISRPPMENTTSPGKRIHCQNRVCVVERLATRPGKAMLVDRIELRPADREEVEEDPHRQATIVTPERDAARRLVELGVRPGTIPQAEVDQPEREQPERSEQRRMRVVERQERAVLVVIDQRRVERAAAEDTGSDEIPERRAER